MSEERHGTKDWQAENEEKARRRGKKKCASEKESAYEGIGLCA